MTSGDRPPSRHLALDTSAYSHLRRRHKKVLDWVAAADAVDLSTTVIGELEAAFRLGTRYQENSSALSEFLAEPFVALRPVSQSVAKRYGELFARLRQAGTPLPVNDIWIAASALDSRAHLITFDSDFARIEGLECTVLKVDS